MADLIDVLGVGAGLGTRAGMSPDMFTDNDPLLILPIGYTLMGNLIYLRCGEDNVPGSLGLKVAWKDVCHHLAAGIGLFLAMLKPWE